MGTPEEVPEMQRIQELLGNLNDQGGLLLLLLVVAVTPGITEELLCRGPLLSTIRAQLGTLWGVLISSFFVCSFAWFAASVFSAVCYWRRAGAGGGALALDPAGDGAARDA